MRMFERRKNRKCRERERERAREREREREREYACIIFNFSKKQYPCDET